MFVFNSIMANFWLECYIMNRGPHKDVVSQAKRNDIMTMTPKEGSQWVDQPVFACMFPNRLCVHFST